jgi:hypothetical protein
MEEGEIEVDSTEPIGLPDITPQFARESRLLGVLDLFRVTNHRRGRIIYLIRFHYLGRRGRRSYFKPNSARRRSQSTKSIVQ